MGATTIQPGGETTVSLTMMMHPGMEGPHLFHITVPVKDATGTAGNLELFVRAMFG